MFTFLDKGKKLEQSSIQTVLWELVLVVDSPERVTTHPGPLNQPPIKPLKAPADSKRYQGPQKLLRAFKGL
jgi:hypothetical protein